MNSIIILKYFEKLGCLPEYNRLLKNIRKIICITTNKKYYQEIMLKDTFIETKIFKIYQNHFLKKKKLFDQFSSLRYNQKYVFDINENKSIVNIDYIKKVELKLKLIKIERIIKKHLELLHHIVKIKLKKIIFNQGILFNYIGNMDKLIKIKIEQNYLFYKSKSKIYLNKLDDHISTIYKIRYKYLNQRFHNKVELNYYLPKKKWSSSYKFIKNNNTILQNKGLLKMVSKHKKFLSNGILTFNVSSVIKARVKEERNIITTSIFDESKIYNLNTNIKKDYIFFKNIRKKFKNSERLRIKKINEKIEEIKFIRSLSNDEEQRILKIASSKTNQIISSKFNIIITTSLLLCLKSRTWLNDEIKIFNQII